MYSYSSSPRLKSTYATGSKLQKTLLNLNSDQNSVWPIIIWFMIGLGLSGSQLKNKGWVCLGHNLEIRKPQAQADQHLLLNLACFSMYATWQGRWGLVSVLKIVINKFCDTNSCYRTIEWFYCTTNHNKVELVLKVALPCSFPH